MYRFLIIFLLLIIIKQNCSAQNNFFATLSNVKSRPLAMGGAFTSLEDDLESLLYNPATFHLYKNKKDFRITFYLNPVSSFVAFRHYSNKFHQKINKTDFGNGSALLVKAIIISSKFFHTGIVFNEESLNHVFNQKSSTFFEFNDLWNNSSNTFFTNLELAKRASIGISSTLYHEQRENQLRKAFGYSYGIMLKPSASINVGLSYVDFPEHFDNFRFPLERIADETMNIGISYHPIASTILSIDVRNLTEENKKNVRELHVGFEQNIFRVAALRFGFFKERFNKSKSYSFGVGILDSNLFFKDKNQLSHNDFIINYSFVYQDRPHTFNRWHFFSLLIRI